MSDYDYTNTGIISKNITKSGDKHPDIKGQINIDGVEYWLAGWLKHRKTDGAPFYSLRAERKDAPSPQSLGSKPSASAPSDDDIPF